MLPKLLTPGILPCRGLAARSLSIAACALVLLSGSSNAQTAASRVTLETRSTASLATAVDAGPLPSSQRLTLTLTFAPTSDRSAALSQFLTDLTTASSPNYRKWITPAQFASTYGATAGQVAAATAWAQAQGLTIESTSPSGSRITLSGFTAQIQSTFAVTLHSYKVSGTAYFANVQQPSLPAETAALFSAIDGLDNLPANEALTLSGTPVTFGALAETIDTNTTPLLTLTSGLCSDAVSPSQLSQYTTLFQQAAAQGITTLSTRTCTSGGFPAALAEVTAVALPGDTAETAAPIAARPGWQSAPGLPSDAFRHSPDLTAASATALASTLSSIAVTMPSGRLGNVNPILYELGPTPGLYTQPDAAPAGTWEPATGLGLVDLDKLAKAFPRGSGSSYASFSASNYSPVHGQSVTFTSNVTSGTGGGTPTGTVSFVTSTGTTLGTGTLTGGTTTFTTNTLAGGSYTVTASYSGDGSYAPASSPSGTLFVQPEPSQLTANVSTGNIVGGTYTVAVTDTAASGVGQPSGNVTLTIEGPGTNYTQALSPAGASSASTTFTIPSNTVGTLTLSIACTTSPSFSCYNADTTTVTVAKATPALTYTYSPNPAVSGSSIALSAAVAAVGTAPVPTGSVTFYDNSTILNSGTLSNGSTSTTGTVPTTSTHSITATYNGDANYNSVTSSSSGSTNPVPTVTLVTSNASPTAGQSVVFTATVAAPAGGATPGGTVTFTDSVSGSLGQGSLSNGVATLTTTALPNGVSTVTASYNGSNSYNPGTSNTVSENVGGSTATLTASISSTSATAGSTVTVTGTVTLPGSTVPSGVVIAATNYPTGGTTNFAGTLVSSGANSATFSIQVAVPTTAGSYLVSVGCSSTDTFSCNTVTLNLASTASSGTVATSTIITSSSYAITYGQSFTLTGKVTPSSTVNGAAPIGTITFTTSSGTFIGSASVGSGGLASYATATPLSAGSYNFIATYSGDSNYAASSSTASGTVTISPTAASITATVNPTTVGTGASTTVSATVTIPGSSVPPSGTVTVTVPGVTGAVYTGTLIATGTNAASVNIAVPAPPAGTYLLQVTCAGNTSFTCTPTTVTLVSTATTTGLIATTTALTLNPTTPKSGQSVILTATVTSATTGASPISGTVLFFNGATQIGSGTVASGVATATVTLTGTTTQTLTAVYSGDTLYATSTSPAVTVALSLVPSGIVISSSATTGVAGNNVTLTAQVNGTVPAGTSPSGTVTFYVQGTIPRLLGSATLAPTGTGLAVATLNTTNIPAGNQTIYAVYSGDTLFSPATSAAISIGVSDYSVAFTPPNITLTRGQTGTAVLQVNTSGGFAGNIALGCTPPPDTEITCSLSQTTLNGAGVSTLSIFTVAATAENHIPGFKTIGGVSLAALLCFLLPGGGKGSKRRRLPAMLLVLLAIGLTANLGCSTTNVTSTPVGGTPLGTVNLTINTAGSDGSSSVRHDYTYQITIQ
jgi:hypothetical protein